MATPCKYELYNRHDSHISRIAIFKEAPGQSLFHDIVSWNGVAWIKSIACRRMLQEIADMNALAGFPCYYLIVN